MKAVSTPEDMTAIYRRASNSYRELVNSTGGALAIVESEDVCCLSILLSWLHVSTVNRCHRNYVPIFMLMVMH